MITNEHLKAANAFGQSLAFIANGYGQGEANAICGFDQTMENHEHKKAFEQGVANLVEVIMRESGNMHKLSYHVAKQIGDHVGPIWPEQFSEFSDIALRAIGRESLSQKRAAEEEGEMLTEEETKAASAKMLLGLVGRGAALTPDMVRALLGISAGAGAAVGGIGWKLNRDTQQDEDDLEAMRAKIDTYDRISNDIESEIKDRGHAV